MIDRARPSVTIRLELHPRVSALGPNLRDELETALAAAVGQLLDELGLPAQPSVEVRDIDLETDFKLWVAGAPLPCSRDLLWEVVRAIEPSRVDRSLNPHKHLVTAADSDAGVTAAYALEYLRRSFVARIHQGAGHLVTPEVAEAYWRAADAHQGGDGGAAAPGGKLEALSQVLRELLDLGIAVEDRATVKRLLAESQANSNEWLVESLIARLRPMTLEVEVEPDYARAVIGELGDSSVPVQDLELAASSLGNFQMLVDGIFYELGVRIPPIRFRANADLPPGTFVCNVNHRKSAPHRGLGPGQVLVNDTVDRLALLNVVATPAVNPANGSECAVIAEESRDLATGAGLTTWDAIGYLILAIAAEVRQNAHCLIDMDMVEFELARLDLAFLGLASDMLAGQWLGRITAVLRSLLRYEISIRDLRQVLHYIKTFDVVLSDTARLIVLDDRLDVDTSLPLEVLTGVDVHAAHVRKGMKRYVSHKYTRGGNTLVVYLLDPNTIEGPIRLHQANERRLDVEDLERIRGAVEAELGNLPPSTQRPVILTTSTVALFLRRELESEFPRLAVLGFQELFPDMNIQPIARISVE